MVFAVTLGAVFLVGSACVLAWTARLIHVGNLDAQALADKLGTPDPVSALDWPELHVRAIVQQPAEPPLVLLLVEWPARPRPAATLLMALDRGDQRSVPLLSQWSATQVSVSPTRCVGAEVELRRKQSLERVHGRGRSNTPRRHGLARAGLISEPEFSGRLAGEPGSFVGSVQRKG